MKQLIRYGLLSTALSASLANAGLVETVFENQTGYDLYITPVEIYHYDEGKVVHKEQRLPANGPTFNGLTLIELTTKYEAEEIEVYIEKIVVKDPTTQEVIDTITFERSYGGETGPINDCMFEHRFKNAVNSKGERSYNLVSLDYHLADREDPPYDGYSCIKQGIKVWM
ncbi:MAG: hypothetical protein ACHP9Y_06220 [Gammaproteobacteria bacterium]